MPFRLFTSETTLQSPSNPTTAPGKAEPRSGRGRDSGARARRRVGGSPLAQAGNSPHACKRLAAERPEARPPRPGKRSLGAAGGGAPARLRGLRGAQARRLGPRCLSERSERVRGPAAPERRAVSPRRSAGAPPPAPGKAEPAHGGGSGVRRLRRRAMARMFVNALPPSSCRRTPDPPPGAGGQ